MIVAKISLLWIALAIVTLALYNLAKSWYRR